MVRMAAFLTIASSPMLAVSRRSDSGSDLGLEAFAQYEEWRGRYGIDRDGDHLTYAERAALFEKRAEAATKHNQNPNRLWTATVNNKFGDYTAEEFQALLGHRPWMRRASPQPNGPSLLQEVTHDENDKHDVNASISVASSIDWRQRITSNALLQAKDQGNCGSDWAVAAAGALEMHAALNDPSAKVQPVSYEQLVACVQNEEHCGGTGGCGGATAKLAFAYVVENGGIASESKYQGYQSGSDGKCDKTSWRPALGIHSFVRLKENRLQPLLEAVTRFGPVVVSADASNWQMYAHGIFTDCKEDIVLNHALLLVGYGFDAKLKKGYWLIRNSWGPGWGEGGYIRILKRSNEEDICGIDYSPQQSVGCDGGASTMEVCGMCGILSDSVYPTGVRWLA